MQPINMIGAGLGSAGGISNVNRSSEASSSIAASTVSASSSSSVLSINQQVSTFLNSVSPTLANNQNLKLLIAALIIQFLLGDGNSQQQGAQGAAGVLEGLSSGRQNSLMISLESSTNTVQIQQQFTRLDVAGAVQTMQQTDSANPRTGGQIDISG